ncbi:formin-like protein 7 [Lolium rigidum]|uniref:formin-like protein 7 n=1 Tax=Lolium rigidum TaxID=89674 RepID=UPI001F5DAF26|nr:formin-like protein 7 [Lolium rigidum]
MADSGDSSPLSAAATDDAHHDHNTNTAPDAAAAVAAAAQAAAPPPSLPPPPPPKVRLMVSYGGRIQPRPHDNQLSYVNGDTKILSIDRPLRFPDFLARLAALARAAATSEICVKYQLPGEDLDALVSVTNDEDLDHLVIEYDRLHLFRGSGSGSSRGGGGATPRLRVFLFPVTPLHPPPPPASPSPSPLHQPNTVVEPPKHEWYLADVRAASPTPQHQPHQPPQETLLVHSPPTHAAVPMAAVPQPVMLTSRNDLDALYGLEYAYVQPPAVKVRDPAAAGEPPMFRDNVPVEIPPKTEDNRGIPIPATDNAMLAPPISPPTEFHRQIHDKLQLADNASLQAPPTPNPLAAQQPPQAPAPVAAQQAPPPPVQVTAQQAPPPPVQVAAQQAPPPAPVQVAAQQQTPAPTPVASQQPAPAPATPAAQVAPAAAALTRNGSNDSLTRAYPPATTTAPPEYYVPKFPEKPQVIPQSSAPPAAYLPVPPGRYASVAPGSAADHGPFFYIHGPPPHGYYASTNPAGNAYYAVAPHNGNGNGNGAAPAPAMSNAYPQVAYDSNGRAVYYTGILPQQYPSPVNGMSASAAVLGTEPSKPVAVKPTVS